MEIEKSNFIDLLVLYMNISMNIRHLNMAESSVAEYSAAEVTFLPPKKHHALGIDKSLFRPINRLAVLCI